MSIRTKINSFLGLLAGRLLSIFSKSPAKPTTADLQRAEFKTSTQRLGIRFTERIRKLFRFRWLTGKRKTPSTPENSTTGEHSAKAKTPNGVRKPDPEHPASNRVS